MDLHTDFIGLSETELMRIVREFLGQRIVNNLFRSMQIALGGLSACGDKHLFLVMRGNLVSRSINMPFAIAAD